MVLQFYVLDHNFNILGSVDVYKSAIWTERFYVAGDFELYVPNTTEYYNLLSLPTNNKDKFILRCDDPTKLGILTNVKYTHDVDSGDMIIASGYTDDYILHSRVFFYQATYNGNIELAIRHMVSNALIQDEMGFTLRAVTGFQLGDIVGLTEEISSQYQGQYLDEAVEAYTKAYEFGYQVDFDYSNQTFTFNLIKPTDRSLDQSVNDPVVFSASLDNLTASEYVNEKVPNTAYAIGYGSGIDRYCESYTVGTNPAGLDRKEFYINAENMSKNGDAMNSITYQTLLKGQARKGLKIRRAAAEAVTGSVLANTTYKLGEDYFLGDIVQIIIMVGNDRKVKKSLKQRVIEVVECYDENGYSCLPTFETIEQ